MATWPSSKATTTHLDNSADDPNQARVDIKLNVENVNKIIDYFTVSTPAEGDILQYDSADARWENKTVAESGLQKVAYASLLTNDGQGSVNFYRFDEISDPYGIATYSSGKLRLETGTYTIEGGVMIDASNYDSNPFFTADGTNALAVTRKSTSGATIGTSLENYFIPMQKFVVSSATTDHYIKFDNSSVSTPFSNETDVIFKITKIS